MVSIMLPLKIDRQMLSSNVLMFSGQGSHYHGMAGELYSRHPLFRQAVNQLDAHAADLIGQSPVRQLYGRRKGTRFSSN